MHGFFVVIGHKKSIIVGQLNSNDLTRVPRHKRTSVWLKNARYKRPCHIRAYRALPLETVVEVAVKRLPNVAGFVVPATAMPCLIPMNHLQLDTQDNS